MVSVIAATPRDYIIFCGSIFEDLLDGHIVDRLPHAFLLKKADGTLMRQTSRFSLITLRTPNGRIRPGSRTQGHARGFLCAPTRRRSRRDTRR